MPIPSWAGSPGIGVSTGPVPSGLAVSHFSRKAAQVQAQKKRIAVGAAIAAMALALAGAGVAAQPQKAEAFAWKDTCTINVVNRAAQSSTRPYGLVQVPPNAVAYALYAALAATGMPTNSSVGFSNTGIPLTGGCQSILYLNNPGSNVTCHAGAPTVGANHFACDGNSTFKIEKDNDDIEGTAYVAAGSSAESSALDLRPRATSQKPELRDVEPGVLQASQLGGKGWKSTLEVSDLGTFGKLFESSTSSGTCGGNDDKAPTPLSGGASLFVRHNGAEAVGELDGRYSSLGKSQSSLAEATSAAGIKCLVKALSAPGYKAAVATGPDFGQGGISTSRVVVTKKGGGFTGYVDVIGLQDGRSNTVVVFFNAGKPASVSHEEDVLAAVAADLQP